MAEVDYEYRASWRAGAYDWAARAQRHERVECVTLTLKNQWNEMATDSLVAKWVDTWLVAADCTGIFVVERSRGGAHHGHGILVGTNEKVSKSLERWQNTRGFTVRKEATDLMGWIMYCFKAVTTETPILWRRSTEDHASILTPADKPVHTSA